MPEAGPRLSVTVTQVDATSTSRAAIRAHQTPTLAAAVSLKIRRA